ncbi:hypothetical protein [Streptomyces sp. NPDC050560]|uniref:hypothetical protein n=1 Tax=Streptomyces sp. NPDC050560 TaxID=3365630 RepID=UPI0037A80A82
MKDGRRSAGVMGVDPVDPVGTVGEDVMTVHELRWRRDRHGALFLWPKCGAGRRGELVTEWLRPVNCADCKALRGT